MVRSTTESLSECIRPVLATWWSETGGWSQIPASVLAQIGYTARSDAFIASVPAYAGRPRAFIKIFPTAAALDADCHGLAIGHVAASADRAVRVPTVLRTMPTERATILEYIPGSPLAALLRRRYLALTGSYLSISRSLGSWLAAFHRAEPASATEAEEVLDPHVQRSLKYLSEAGELLGHERLARARRLLEAIIRNATCRTAVRVLCHGDFAVYNVLIKQGQPYVIDFAYATTAFPEIDLVRFQHSLWMSIGCLPFSRPARRAMWSAFVSGYGRDAITGMDRQIWELIEFELLTEAVALHRRSVSRSSHRGLWKTFLLRCALRRLEHWIDERGPTYQLCQMAKQYE